MTSCTAVQTREARASHSIRTRGLMRARLALTHAHCFSLRLRLSGLQTVPSSNGFTFAYIHLRVVAFGYTTRSDERNGTYSEKQSVRIHTRAIPCHFGQSGSRAVWVRLGFLPISGPPASESQEKILTTRPVVPEIPHPTVLSVWCHDHLSSSIDIVLLVACSVPKGAEQGGDSVP